MWWLLLVLAQFITIAAGMKDDQRAGLWSWPKFSFALGFAALECAILIAPIAYIHDTHSRYFIPFYVASCIVAALNFIWIIIVARRWKLPDGCTNLQAYRDEHRAKTSQFRSAPQDSAAR